MLESHSDWRTNRLVELESNKGTNAQTVKSISDSISH